VRLRLHAVAFLLAASTCSAEPAAPRIVPLESLSPLAATPELVRRTFSPTSQDRLRQVQASTGKAPPEYSIDPEEEELELFVPSLPDSGRYGLLVFVMPADIPMPEDWRGPLQRAGYILVSAQRSGNSQSVQGRRIPLALHAYEHVRSRYPLDPARVFIGGFSGGSRMAQWTAMAYPDVFRGAMLVGGSLQIGEYEVIFPPRELALKFLSSSKLVFATGSEDALNGGIDRRNRKVLESLCFQGYARVAQMRLGHWLPSGGGLTRILSELEKPVVTGEGFDQCVQGLDADIERRLAEVETLIAAGRMNEAGIALGEMEDRYGGLAGDRAVPLARTISQALSATAEAK
jgi:pimeloyl-ACP methyl ester carboxylesterase